jgi:hypothetical protein
MGSSDFYDLPLRRQKLELEGRPFWAPVWCHDNQGFSAVFTASSEAVAAELPSEVIQPLRWTGDRTLVHVFAFRYPAVTWAGPDGSSGSMLPYAEAGVAPLVTEGPAPRVLPMLRGRVGEFPLQLGETTHESVAGGRDFFGFPKFLADMDFTETGTSRSVVISEQGQHLLTLTVRPGGRPRELRLNARMYTAFRGELLRTVAPMWGIARTRWGSGAATLELGDHPVAEQLQRLDVSTTPINATSMVGQRAVMPMPGPGIGPARDYPAYQGSDTALARYTVTYPYGPAMDQYESLRQPA